MAAGDFEQRISAGFVPDEVRDLADSYNTMAATLGDAFGDIQESRRQIAAVVESMAEGVVAFDSSGVVVVTTPVAVRLLAVPDRDLLGMSAETITTASVRPAAADTSSSARMSTLRPSTGLLLTR